MFVVTAFDQQRKPVVNVKQSSPEDAAKVAISLAYAEPFIRVADGQWNIVFQASFPVSKARLAHIIEHHAEVEFA